MTVFGATAAVLPAYLGDLMGVKVGQRTRGQSTLCRQSLFTHFIAAC